MDLLLIGLLAFLFQTVAHYLPWQGMIGQRLPSRFAAYIIGTLLMVGPYTGWLMVENAVMPTSRAALGLWICVVSSGAAVAFCYGLDHLLTLTARAREAEERERMLLDAPDVG